MFNFEKSTDKFWKDKLKKDRKVNKALSDLNKSQSNLEKSLSKYLGGRKVELSRYELKDFIK